MILQAHHLRIYADYYQFYLFNPNLPGNTADPGFWNKEAFARRFGYIPGTIGIGTASYDFVKAILEVHDGVPDLSLNDWDHVIECDLDAPDGRIGIAGCLAIPADEHIFDVTPGNYRVRCCYADLDKSSDDMAEGEEAGDWYLVQCWLQKDSPPVVRKWRPQEGA
ncbi:MAG TPA: hypothetical protein VKU19_18775 [Bryobacteraceae bacterium]|nr:hypothetical protein [Bryobacteraceae bacterium]